MTEVYTFFQLSTNPSRELDPRELDPRELDPRDLDPRELDPTSTSFACFRSPRATKGRHTPSPRACIER